MRILRLGMVVLSLLVLSACDSGSVTTTVMPDSDKNSSEQNTAEAEGAFDPMLSTIDRAKNADQASDERKNSLDDAMRDAEGN